MDHVRVLSPFGNFQNSLSINLEHIILLMLRHDGVAVDGDLDVRGTFRREFDLVAANEDFGGQRQLVVLLDEGGEFRSRRTVARHKGPAARRLIVVGHVVKGRDVIGPGHARD